MLYQGYCNPEPYYAPRHVQVQALHQDAPQAQGGAPQAVPVQALHQEAPQAQGGAPQAGAPPVPAQHQDALRARWCPPSCSAAGRSSGPGSRTDGRKRSSAPGMNAGRLF
ncbi:hypothetical protein DIPPA_30697 [Diplonema papillatum]|nr:hypothetical protein DIPPA_30697 [Diplonema papillatum]